MSERHNKPWTKEEKEYLQDHLARDKSNILSVANNLGRTIDAIKSKLNRLNKLIKIKRPEVQTLEEEILVLQGEVKEEKERNIRLYDDNKKIYGKIADLETALNAERHVNKELSKQLEELREEMLVLQSEYDGLDKEFCKVLDENKFFKHETEQQKKTLSEYGKERDRILIEHEKNIKTVNTNKDVLDIVLKRIERHTRTMNADIKDLIEFYEVDPGF